MIDDFILFLMLLTPALQIMTLAVAALNKPRRNVSVLHFSAIVGIATLVIVLFMFVDDDPRDTTSLPLLAPSTLTTIAVCCAGLLLVSTKGSDAPLSPPQEADGERPEA